MRILAFDTATPATAVAVAEMGDAEEGRVARAVERRDDPRPGARPNHTSRLLELIEDALGAARIDWPELDRLAVGIGPGTFTGLRIGIATAQALARARGLALVGVSTLQGLALPAAEAQPGRDVLAVLDARRGEVFAAGWPAGSQPGHDRPGLKPCVLAPAALEQIASELAPGALAVGDGAIKFSQSLSRLGLLVPPEDSELHRIKATTHCRLAAGASPGEPDAVRPEYLRQPDAEIARRT